MKKKISKDSVVSQYKDLVISKIDGDSVMMSIKSGEYYGMDSMGSRIWENIKEPVRVSDLVNTLRKNFDVDKSVCEKDVLEFLNKIAGHNVIQVETP